MALNTEWPRILPQLQGSILNLRGHHSANIHVSRRIQNGVDIYLVQQNRVQFKLGPFRIHRWRTDAGYPPQLRIDPDRVDFLAPEHPIRLVVVVDVVALIGPERGHVRSICVQGLIHLFR